VGLLQEVTAGREKLFLHPKFLDLLLSDTHTFALYRKEQRERRKPPTRGTRPGTKTRKASKPKR